MTPTRRVRPTVSKRIKQVSIKPKKCPNPLFVKWIKEWIDEAVSRKSNVRFQYRKALNSIQNYPLLLRSGKDCGVLQDFGPKLCAKLDFKLAEYRKANPDGIPEQKQSKVVKRKPQHVSSPQKSAKTEVVQNDSDTGFVVADQIAEENTWESELQKRCLNAHDISIPPSPPSRKKTKAITESCEAGSSQSSSSSSPSKRKKKTTGSECAKNVILQPGHFEIILLVDTAETFKSAKGKESAIQHGLTSLNVKSEVRSLKVGDFAWVARDRIDGHELVLPYIIERKRLDDLARSIKDGRYREQKFRLKQCGIQNRIYLIESMGKADLHLGLPIATIRQASINTQIHGEFSVKHSSSHWDSMQYLATLTRVIIRTYKDKILVQCSKENQSKCDINEDLVSLMGFNDFNQGASKTRKWRVREMFIKHLIQLRGLSVEKAVAIVERYPSPQALLAAYAMGDGALLLAKIPFGSGGKTIGPVISTVVHQLYTCENIL